MRTLIAVPCMDTLPVGFVQSLLYLDMGKNVSVMFKQNSLIYDSRNLISLHAIENKFDRVMWFDSDMMFMPATLKMLTDDMDGLSTTGDESITDFHGCDMVTGVYYKRHGTHDPVLYQILDEPVRRDDGRLEKQITTYKDYPKNKLFKISGCGFGCCMTSTKLLKDVWDHFGPAFTPYPWAGEDLSFCHRVNQLGYDIWCDSRVTCGHIGTFVYTEETCKGRGDAH